MSLCNKEYLNMIYVIDDLFEKNKFLIEWENKLLVRCNSITGMYETDTEPGDEDYIGEYAAGVGDVEILNLGMTIVL